MNNSLLIVCIVFCSTILFGQESPIEWGDIQKKQGRLIKVLSDTPGEFYTLRWLGGSIGGSYQATRNIGLNRIARNRIRLVINKSFANFESAGIVGGDFAIFLSNKQDGQNKLFMQKYDINLQPKGDQVLLASYDIKPSIKGVFEIVFSPRRNYFVVTWELPGRKDRRHVSGFNIYNDEIERINNGEYPLPYDPKCARVLEHYISDLGDYFMAFSEFKDTDKSFIRKGQAFKVLHVYHIDTNGLRDILIDIDGRRIEAMTMSTNNYNELLVTGIYGLENALGVSGIFHKKIELSVGKFISESYKDFESNFITEGWSEKALKRLERRELKGKGTTQLQNYKMKEAIVLEDGSIIGTMEQYYVQVYSSSNVNTSQYSDKYYYHFNDIIAFKILAEGGFDWITKIRKSQVSINDGGPYSSYSSYLSDSILNFIFNDNIMNYDEDGIFNSALYLYTADYSRKKNVVTLAGVDLNTGGVEREVFFDRSEIEAIAVPKMFNVNYVTSEMILYSTWGRNERIGSLKF